MAVSEKRRKPGGARPDGPLLEREQIIAAGLELTRRHGLDGMSMRKLGQELGVTSMAIYWYFKGRDELVEAITDSVLASIELPPDDGAAWDERLRRFAWAVHDVLVEYPGIADELLTHQNYPPSAVPLVEYSVAVLREAGFDELNASTAFNVLTGFVVGRAHFEAYQRLVDAQSEGPSSVAERARAGWQRLNDRVEGAPNTASYVRLIGSVDDPATIFEHGLELLLRGLRDEIES
jgi:TetR/AcrR family tetracycline transcriptional repressor